MFGANKSLAEVACGHQRADWRLHRHIESQKLMVRHKKNRVAFYNVCSCMHTSIVCRVVSKLQFRESGTALFHPVKHVLETLALRVVQGNTLVCFKLVFCFFDELFNLLDDLSIYLRLTICNLLAKQKDFNGFVDGLRVSELFAVGNCLANVSLEPVFVDSNSFVTIFDGFLKSLKVDVDLGAFQKRLVRTWGCQTYDLSNRSHVLSC